MELEVVKRFKRNFSVFNDFCEKHKHLVIYGAGTYGDNTYKLLRKYNKPVAAFVVSDGQDKQETCCGIPVFTLSELPYAPEDCGIIIALTIKFHREILSSLLKRGFSNIYPYSGQRQIADADLLEYYDKIKVLYIIDFLLNLDGFGFGDRVWNFRGFKLVNPYLLGNFATWEVVAELQDFILPSLGYSLAEGGDGPYEYGPVKLELGDVVFDCGANYGSFSALAVYKGCTVHAFEPSPSNRQILQKVISDYSRNISISPYALSDTGGEIWFCDSGADVMNCIAPDGGEGSIKVDAITLDEYVANNNITKLDFIKADIEGAERLMLKGAQKTLCELAPKLALCTYHLPDDKAVMSELIMNANPRYEIMYGHSKLYAYVPK